MLVVHPFQSLLDSPACSHPPPGCPACDPSLSHACYCRYCWARWAPSCAGQHPGIHVSRPSLCVPHIPAASRLRGAGTADQRPCRQLQAPGLAGCAGFIRSVILPGRLQVRCPAHNHAGPTHARPAVRGLHISDADTAATAPRPPRRARRKHTPHSHHKCFPSQPPLSPLAPAAAAATSSRMAP